MSASSPTSPHASEFSNCKVIYCILPDDGTDKRVLAELRKKHGIVRGWSATRRGIGALAEVKTKRGKLPLPNLVKLVHVICSEEQADEVFDFMFWSAGIDKPGRGAMWQRAVSGCTPYGLPPDVPDEDSGA